MVQPPLAAQGTRVLLLPLLRVEGPLMSRLSILAELEKRVAILDEGMIVTMGLTPCCWCHDSTTRMRSTRTGVTVCWDCWDRTSRLSVAPTCPWEKPKGFRVSRKRSDDEQCFLVDGPGNGEFLRRGSKMDTGKKATLVKWPLYPLIVRDGCWYALDPLDDVYHHACPTPPPEPKKSQVRKRKAPILVEPF